MRIFVFIMLGLATQVGAAPTAKWSLVRAFLAAGRGAYLCVDFTIDIRAVDEDLQVEGWRGVDSPDVVRIDIDIVASDGTKLPAVLSTGPADSFRKQISITRGESRRFLVSTGLFSITKPGWYVAKGILRGITADGHPLNVPLEDIRFQIEISDQKKEPNKSAQTTPRGFAPLRV